MPCNAEMFLRSKLFDKGGNGTVLLLDMPLGGIAMSKFVMDNIDKEQLLVEVVNKALTSLKKLHELGIYHADLNTDNILINETDKSNIKAQIMDFGQSDMNINKTQDKLSNLLFIIIDLMDYMRIIKNQEILEHLMSNPNIMFKFDLLKFIKSFRDVTKQAELPFETMRDILSNKEIMYTYESIKQYLESK